MHRLKLDLRTTCLRPPPKNSGIVSAPRPTIHNTMVLAMSVQSICTRWVNNPARGRPGDVNLPLLKGQTAETYDLPFWLELHARLYGVKKGAWPALFAFWNRAPSKVEPCVLLSFGRPSPNLTRFIVSPDVKDEAWCEGLPQTGESHRARSAVKTSH